jgi:alkylation response protein AidB-like acyl-CoA dehydrogenase
MFVELEQLRSAALYAAVMRDTEAREIALAAAKYVALKAMRFIGQQIVHLHGGIGVTEEYAAGHYFMRLTAIAAQLGAAEDATAAIAAQGGFTGPASYWEAAA